MYGELPPIEVMVEVEYLPLVGRHRKTEAQDRQWRVTAADLNGVRVSHQQACSPLAAVMGQVVDTAWACFTDAAVVESIIDRIGLVWLGESDSLGDDLRVTYGLVMCDQPPEEG